MSNRGTILIVEDEPELRSTLGQLLELFGYKAIGAPNGKEALELLKSDSPPAAILLDMMMPVMSGDTFLKVMSSQTHLSAIPVIQMSAVKFEKHQDACCAIDKPFNIERLIKLIETCPRIASRVNLAHS